MWKPCHRIEVLCDDRDARPGFKFKDADLIGCPIRLTVGKRGLADDIVEIKVRTEDEVAKVSPNEAAAAIRAIIERLTP